MPPRKKDPPFNRIKLPTVVVESEDVLVLLERLTQIRLEKLPQEREDFLLEIALLGWLQALRIETDVTAYSEEIKKEGDKFKSILRSS